MSKKIKNKAAAARAPSVNGNSRPGYTEFELDLTRALLEHLPGIFERLGAEPLTQTAVKELPEKAQGVYMLLDEGRPTYIGKTDAEHGFRDRLDRHFFTLSSRRNLDLGKISFKAVRVMVFTTVNVETTLIKHFLHDNKLTWQFSGFGSNDPGHNREGQEPSNFDKKYPINIDLPLSAVQKGAHNALQLLMLLKSSLPYDFRYGTDIGANGRAVKHTKGHIDQRSTSLNVPRNGMTLRALFEEVLIPQMPGGWVATVFPGRVIYYKEPTEYRYVVERFPVSGGHAK